MHDQIGIISLFLRGRIPLYLFFFIFEGDSPTLTSAVGSKYGSDWSIENILCIYIYVSINNPNYIYRFQTKHSRQIPHGNSYPVSYDLHTLENQIKTTAALCFHMILKGR